MSECHTAQRLFFPKNILVLNVKELDSACLIPNRRCVAIGTVGLTSQINTTTSSRSCVVDHKVSLNPSQSRLTGS
jgi:hypothetical protein